MSDTIRFILNGQARAVSDLPPTMTVLQYLRTVERLTGTKEGCAEGDCGACTVIVGTLQDDGAVRQQAINACIQFLPTLDGKQVTTVEHLGMNAVQRAMIDYHASQCGFCTPGFVMSLTCLAHNNNKADDTAIQDAIAGNLCRCTGYRPILDAARQATKSRDKIESEAAALKKIQRSKMLSYEAAEGIFFAPVTTDELTAVLQKYPDAVMLAGGTDVGLWATKHHRALPVIVYLSNIRELCDIAAEADGLVIGAGVTWSDAFVALAKYDSSMEILLRRFASAQIRNVGTIGGNIANGSPIGDGMLPLIALGAQIVLRAAADTRTVNLEDYYLAYGKQDRRAGEFVEKIIVPPKDKNTLFRVYKISKRFDQDISAVCAAFALTVERGTITAARIAFGGMAATPKRATRTEMFLTGKPWSEDTIRAAKSYLDKDYTPLTDMRASASYRATIARNLLQRFWLETGEDEQEGRVYGYGG